MELAYKKKSVRDCEQPMNAIKFPSERRATVEDGLSSYTLLTTDLEAIIFMVVTDDASFNNAGRSFCEGSCC